MVFFFEESPNNLKIFSCLFLHDLLPGTIDLQILGYTATEENANSLVLKAEEGYSIATSPFHLHKFSANLDDHSVQVGLTALQWILSPIDSQCFFRFSSFLKIIKHIFFFSDIFQKRVLVVKRSASTYFEGIFSTQMFTKMLQNVKIHI
jgi:hypothetical protein